MYIRPGLWVWAPIYTDANKFSKRNDYTAWAAYAELQETMGTFAYT